MKHFRTLDQARTSTRAPRSSPPLPPVVNIGVGRVRADVVTAQFHKHVAEKLSLLPAVRALYTGT